MRNATSYIAIVAALALPLCLPAYAQSSSFFRTLDAADYAVGTHNTELQTNIDEMSAASTAVRRGTLILSGTWEGISVTIDADANLQILGSPANNPALTILRSSAPTLDVITIKWDSTMSRPLDNLVIEGLTIEGGRNGVSITGAPTADYRPTLARCIIQSNSRHGVYIPGPADPPSCTAIPLLVNCSINRNDEDGVHAEGDTGPDVLHCTIFENDGDGVFIASTTGGSVRNSILYRNGDGVSALDTDPDNEAGVRWETNPFIDPDEGSYMGGTDVTITGNGLWTTGAASTTNVYFGPPDLDVNNDLIPDTLAAFVGGVDGDPQVLTVTTPPSHTGAPGPVDVYIERDDGFITAVPKGFNYVEDESGSPFVRKPYVTRVDPGQGPLEGGNYVMVEGARFDPRIEVGFDFNDDGVLDADERSDRVELLSSARLWVKVPPGTAGRYDVLVRNVVVDQTSDKVPFDEYTYLSEFPFVQPQIIEISPNFVRETDGTNGPSKVTILARILGWNLEPDVVVRIGDIVCPYGELIKGDDDNLDGNTFDELKDVRIPAAQFGTGGSYDVEVTNPGGLFDILPNGFTYYSDGAPELDPDTYGQWRPANFVLSGDGQHAGQNLTLRGVNYDSFINVLWDPSDLTGAGPGANDITGVRLRETVEQHVGHTQRQVFFVLPTDPEATPDDTVSGPNFPTAYDPTVNMLEVQIENAFGLDGILPTDSPADVEAKRTGITNVAWAEDIDPSGPALGAGEALYYEILATRPGSDITRIEVDVHNYVSEMKFYIAGVEAASATSLNPGNRNQTIELTLPTLPTLPAGVYGSQDLTVALLAGGTFNKTAADLYAVDEIWIARRDALDQVLRPYGRAVTPKTVPSTGGVEVRIFGSDFLGPDEGGEWAYTDAEILWGASNKFSLKGNAVGADDYVVVSGHEIRFTAPDAVANSIPLDTPLDIRLVHTDPGGGTGGSYTMPGAIVFSSSAVPVIDVNGVNNIDAVPNPVPYGDVRGGYTVEITGTNFMPDFPANPPFVLFGGVEARVITASDTQIDVEAPAAPFGRPGFVDVTVISRQGAGPVTREGTLEDGFEYIMDGQPEIDQIAPNFIDKNKAAAASNLEPVYFTLTGKNFQGKVEVLFDSTLDGDTDPDFTSAKFFSVSPFEIVVDAPTTTTLGLTQTDFDNNAGIVEIEVWVRNLGSEDANAESNRRVLTYYDPAVIDPVDPRVPEVSFNDAFLNYVNYVSVTPGKGSVSMDPLLDPGNSDIPGPRYTPAPLAEWWPGKLALIKYGDDDQYNPMRDKAGDFKISPFTLVDLESFARPGEDSDAAQGTGQTGSSLADIGADEIQDPNADLQDWYYAEVISENACAVGILGAVNAGDAFIEIRVTAGRNFTLLDDEVFAVPQGGNPNFIDHRIPLTITEDLGGGIFFLTNAEDIQTVVYPPNDNEPSQGDIIADGHAALYIQLGGFGSGNPIIGFDPLPPTIDIIDQAIYGRHFLIDTIAPFIDLVATDTNGFADGVANAFDLVPTYNDAWVSGNAELTTHPFPSRPLILFDTGEYWSPYEIEAPVDYLGQLLLPPLVPPTIGTQIFFNNSSMAHWPRPPLLDPPYPPDSRDLSLTVSLDFVDPVVMDYTGVTPVPIENGPNDIDYYTGLPTREVSGFLRNEDGGADSSATDGPFDVNEFLDDYNRMSEIQWIFRRNQSQFRSADPISITVNYAVSGANEGFDRDDPNSTKLYNNELINGQFDIEELNDDIALDDTFHVELQFQAKDCAGNITEQQFIVDPLHLWWLTKVQSQINPNREGQEVRNPSFTWQLDRSFDTNVQGGPRPIFTYKLFATADISGYDTGYYEFISNWAPWSAEKTFIDAQEVLDAVYDGGLESAWVLLVVVAADEAGNVEPIGDEFVGTNFFNASDEVDLGDPALGNARHNYILTHGNMMRFFVGPNPAPDTAITPVFYHVDLDPSAAKPLSLGSNTLVPLPSPKTDYDEVEGHFQIDAIMEGELPAGGVIKIHWDLIEDGDVPVEVVASGVFNPAVDNSPVNPRVPGLLVLPDQLLLASGDTFGLGDDGNNDGDTQDYLGGNRIDRRKPVSYVLRAWAFVDAPDPDTGAPRNNIWDPGELIDNSPAALQFTVTPTGVSGFVRPPDDPDAQPTRLREEL